MKVYKIHTDFQGNYKAVKRGWSWSAFGLTCLWAMQKKICKVSTFSMSFFFVLSVFAFISSAILPEVMLQFSPSLLFIYAGYLALGLGLFMGFNGNHWYEKNLFSQGYRYQEMVVAESAENAITLYIKQNEQYDLLAA